jgi:hypothetical protein
MIEIPPESQAVKRLQSVSEQVQLTYYELLLKWLDDEEKRIQVQHDIEDLSGWQKRLETQLNKIAELFRGKTPEDEIADSKTDAPSEKDYRQQVIEKIQNLREQGLTFSKISAQFNAEAVATMTGTGKWYPSSISQLLQHRDSI